MSLFSSIRWSVKLDIEMIFFIDGISFVQKIAFITKKYLLFIDYMFMIKGTANTKCVTVFGQQYFVNSGHALASLQRVYCSSSFLKKYISPGAVIVDVGANIGQFNFFCRHFLRAKRVISFEPVIESYELLIQNAGNHDSYNYIISDREKLIPFHVDSHATQLSTYVGKAAAVSAVTIQAHRLDTVLAELCIDCVDLLKVDTEGSEFEVIESIGRLMRIVKAALIEASIFRENVGSLFRVGHYMEINGFHLEEFMLQNGSRPTDADVFFTRLCG